MVYINPEGIRAMNVGRKLSKNASTPEEIAVAKAYKRVTWGTVILVLFFAAVLFATVFWALSAHDGTGNIHRTGTVQEDGTVRYVHNEYRYLTLDELGLADAGLQPKDKVTLGFDHRDELIYAAPASVYQAEQDLRLSVMLSVMILMVVVLLVYALVICRYTSFGSAWYGYMRQLKKKEDKDLPLKTKIVIYAIATVIALVICAPQIAEIVGNIRHMQQIEQFGNLINSVEDAAQKSEDVSDKLDDITVSPDALQDAADASQTIRDILENMKEEE